MDILIQNNGSNPLYLPIRSNSPEGGIDHTVIFGEHQVTKVSQEIYEKFIITSEFFKSRMEDGTIRALNADMIGEKAINESAQMGELAYAKYVDLMKKIRSAGGLANKQFAEYLNSDGTPKIDLLHANFGRNIDPEVAEQFRIRYLAEAGEGMHEDKLKLPGGHVVETGHRDVEIEAPATDENQNVEASEEVADEPSKELVDQINRIKKMNLDDLKKVAMAMEVDFDADVTGRVLRKAVIDRLKANANQEDE